ncbi:MAG: type IV pilus twitching motility protein PilT [Candidatus Margulisiibacteriota bacterium]|jgi:twitching motility protein PilT
MKIDSLLEQVVDKKASDLHLVAGQAPILRINGLLVPIGSDQLTSETIKIIFSELMTAEEMLELEKSREMDFAYAMASGKARFRVNVHFQKDTMGAALRLIPKIIPTAEELGLPQVIQDIVKMHKGLVLITGPTGSGKSTTMAVMLDMINKTQSKHIITIEDPIEFGHNHQQCLIEKREVGRDTHSFAESLKRSLRQDPDVILVGEMRDPETIATAITAAETGHLVFSTLHTNDTVQTIDRIIDVFPAHQQPQIRQQLSMCLGAVLAQRLMLKKDKKGRVVAIETLIATDSVRNIIRKGNTHELYSIMEIESKMGMRTMSQAMKDLAAKGLIEEEVAKPR